MPNARRAVARSLHEPAWDIALLCVGCPAQELIAHQLAELGCQSGIALCVGASIDFLTGARARAPLWLQHLGLEWAYRLATGTTAIMAPIPRRVAADHKHLSESAAYGSTEPRKHLRADAAESAGRVSLNAMGIFG